MKPEIKERLDRYTMEANEFNATLDRFKWWTKSWTTSTKILNDLREEDKLKLEIAALIQTAEDETMQIWERTRKQMQSLYASRVENP